MRTETSQLLSDPQANISKSAEPEDWRYREAATTALGAILEGPSTDRLAAYVSQGLSFLLHAMKDGHQQVRHSTAWTIGASAPADFSSLDSPMSPDLHETWQLPVRSQRYGVCLGGLSACQLTSFLLPQAASLSLCTRGRL